MDGVGNGQYYSYWIERLSGFDDGRTIVAGVLDGRKKKAKKQKAKGKKKAPPSCSTLENSNMVTRKATHCNIEILSICLPIPNKKKVALK